MVDIIDNGALNACKMCGNAMFFNNIYYACVNYPKCTYNTKHPHRIPTQIPQELLLKHDFLRSSVQKHNNLIGSQQLDEEEAIHYV